MSFAQFVDRVLAHEGGFIDHPADPGGATNFGITQRVARSHGYQGDMRAFTKAQAIEVYRKDYWGGPRLYQLPPALAFQVFDAGVNHGPARAVQWLQKAVATPADGILGPQTVAAVLNRSQAQVINDFNAVRLDFYASLGTFNTFGKGWTRRVAGNLRHAAHDLVAL